MVGETLTVFRLPQIRKNGQCLDGQVGKDFLEIFGGNCKKTKIEKFQSEETLQIEISRDEQLLNVIERMEKFRCDDSDDE